MSRSPRWFLAVCFFVTQSLAAAEPGYVVVRDWPVLPEGQTLGLCAGVGVDSKNQVFVFHRCGRAWATPFPTEPIAEATVSVFDGPSGKRLRAWGANQFVMPHGLTVDHEGNVWLTDVALQQVFKFTNDGKLLLTLGVRGEAGSDHGHFNLPTDVAVRRDGSFWVSDGYRNARVMKFSADGRYKTEWGSKGSASGQFNLPHGIAVDTGGRVYVCDRSNSRVQVFDPKGIFVAEWKGAHIGRPYGIDISASGQIFVIDGGDPDDARSARGKVVVLDAGGQVLESFGAYGKGPGQFRVGHDIAVGPDGAVYVAEGGGKRVQKFSPGPGALDVRKE